MISSTYNLLFVIAALASYVAISRRVDERLGGGFATVVWGVLVAASFNIVVYSGGSSFTQSSGALAFVSLAGAVMMAIFTLAAATGRLPAAQNTRFAQA